LTTPRCLASVPAPRPVTARIDAPRQTLSGSATRSHRRASPRASSPGRRATSLSRRHFAGPAPYWG